MSDTIQGQIRTARSLGEIPLPNAPRTLGEWLRHLRHNSNLTLREVEERSGISNSYLSQLETGHMTRPHPYILRGLADMYHISYEWLMWLTGYLEQSQPTPLRHSVTDMLAGLDEAQLSNVRTYIEYLYWQGHTDD